MRPGRAAAAFVAAAVQRAVAGDAVVVAGDGAAVLAALTGRAHWPPSPIVPPDAAAGAADAIDAEQAAAAIACPGRSAPPLLRQQLKRPSASMPLDAQTTAPAGLAALPSLGALGAPMASPPRRVVGADAVDAIETATAIGAVADAGAGAALVAATVERPIAIEPIVGADGCSASLRALLRTRCTARRGPDRRTGVVPEIDPPQVPLTQKILAQHCRSAVQAPPVFRQQLRSPSPGTPLLAHTTEPPA